MTGPVARRPTPVAAGRRSRRRILCAATALGAVVFAVTTAASAQQGWPRQRATTDGYTVTLYQPQIDSWEDGYSKITFSGVVGVTAPGGDEPELASYLAIGATDTSFVDRQVRLHDLELAQLRFPALSEAEAQTLGAKVREVLPSERILNLDEVLAHIELSADRATAAKSAPVIEEPPVILVSTKLAVLVLFDGDPLWAPVEGVELKFAINTNWDLLQDGATSRLYLLYDDAWLAAASLDGPWTPAGKLPAAFAALPADDNWKTARESQPGRKLKTSQVPAVHVSTRPAELILIEGEPKLTAITGTRLSWVENSENDLFFDDAGSQWYFLVSGRWFRSASLKGPWQGATADLPAEFASIPGDHPRGRVRPSVPGTPEAEEAVLLAQVPRRAEVARDGSVDVDVVYAGEPEWKSIEGTSMAYATNTSFDVIRVGDLYYVCYQGVWFLSSTPNGPWTVTPDVPQSIYSIPPSSPKYNVTYVTVYDTTPDTVVYGYTSGYWGMYASWGVVVFGTGYYYPPYVYWGPYYPYYYPYWYSYGAGAWYNPATGVYGRAAAVYGPYGGAGAAAAYNPRTGTYGRSTWAYGPYGAGWAGRAYNPRSDTGFAGYQRANSYAQWGESVVRRGDDWVHTGHYTDDRGTVAGGRTSEGGRAVGVGGDDHRGFVGQSGSGDVYAGKDGNIYRRDEGGGWSKYDGGEWSPVEGARPQLEESARAREAAASRDLDAARERAQAATPTDRQPASDRAAQARDQRAQAGAGDRATAARRPSGASAGSLSPDTLDRLQRDARARSTGSERASRYSGSWSSRARSGGYSGGRSTPSRGSGGARRRR